MWISDKGLHNYGDNGFRFPYKAKSINGLGIKEFKNEEDVFKELILHYDDCINKGIANVGESLYLHHFFFCNTYLLLDQKSQDTVKKYNYCKAFNCPPYSSLKETPYDIYEDFITINGEVNSIKASERKKQKNV